MRNSSNGQKPNKRKKSKAQSSAHIAWKSSLNSFVRTIFPYARRMPLVMPWAKVSHHWLQWYRVRSNNSISVLSLWMHNNIRNSRKFLIDLSIKDKNQLNMWSQEITCESWRHSGRIKKLNKISISKSVYCKPLKTLKNNEARFNWRFIHAKLEINNNQLQLRKP